MDWKDLNASMRDKLKPLNRAIPEPMKGFAALSKAAKEGGALDTKTLECIAIAIAVADRCDPCIGFHIEAFIKCGGTREELNDVLAMCIQMGGGPSLMYAAKTLDCYDQLAA